MAVGDAGGDKYRRAHYFGPVREGYHQLLAGAAQPRRVARKVEGSAEQPSLGVGLRGQLLAADPVREAQVVADQGARARLPAEGLPLHHEGVETFRSAVDCSGKPRRTSSHDYQLESPLVRPYVHPERYVLGKS